MRVEQRIGRVDRLEQTASHVVIENFKPEDRAKFGVDAASVHEVNPRAVICSIVGRLLRRGSGREWTSFVCHSATPTGLLMSRRAYSAITRSRVLHSTKPIVGLSSGCRSCESTADR